MSKHSCPSAPDAGLGHEEARAPRPCRNLLLPHPLVPCRPALLAVTRDKAPPRLSEPQGLVTLTSCPKPA